jgi:hypothetical protein
MSATTATNKRKRQADPEQYEHLASEYYSVENTVTTEWLEEMQEHGLLSKNRMAACVDFMKKNFLVLQIGDIYAKGYEGKLVSVSYDSSEILTECCGCDSIFVEKGGYDECDDCGVPRCYDCAMGEGYECERPPPKS